MRLPLAVLIGIVLCLLVVLAGCPRPSESAAPDAGAPDPPAPTMAPQSAYPMTVTDDLGAVMAFDHPVQRVLTLAPSLTETAFALGLGDRIVGVTNYCKYPPEALQKEKIGGYVDSSEERIVSLAPDVIFATRGTPRTFIDSLRATGLKVYALEQNTFEQVCDSITKIGRVCGVDDKAQVMAGELRATRDEIAAKTASLVEAKRPRAIMVVSFDPLFVAGPGSFQDEMLTACGARNVSGLKASFATLSLEAVVQSDPQVIVMTNDENGRKMTLEGQLKKLKASPAWRGTTAVKSGRVCVVDVNHVSIPGPRLVLGLKELAHGIHPELFPAP